MTMHQFTSVVYRQLDWRCSTAAPAAAAMLPANSGIDTWGSTGGEDRVGSHDGDSSTAVDVSSDCSGCDVAGGNGGIGKQGNTGG